MQGAQLSVRTEVRRQTRTLARRREDVAIHLARVHASLQLDGVEPVQGALADLFSSFDESASTLKSAALQLAGPRLGIRMTRHFQAWVSAPALPRITPLATRWSLIASASANISTRARRCSADDSRLVAAQALKAWDTQDLAAQEDFLHHCLTCKDKLAFMLVRRELLKRQARLPAGWREADSELQAGGA